MTISNIYSVNVCEIITNSAAHNYSSFEYSSITLKFPKAQLTLFNIYRPPLHHLILNLSLPFLTNSHLFFSMQPRPLTNSSSLVTSISMLMIWSILKQSNLFTSLPVVTSVSMLKFYSQTWSYPIITLIITYSYIVTSDHIPIFTKINVHPNPPPPPTNFTYRRINAIDYPKFINDLNSSPFITNPPSSLPDLLDTYFVTLRSLLDNYAPLLIKSNQSSRTVPTPWITTEILNLKIASRRLEYLTLYFRH